MDLSDCTEYRKSYIGKSWQMDGFMKNLSNQKKKSIGVWSMGSTYYLESCKSCL